MIEVDRVMIDDLGIELIQTWRTPVATAQHQLIGRHKGIKDALDELPR